MDILIVEDSGPTRNLLRYLLESRFHKEASFREADRLEGAMQYLKSRPFDCVILDLSLPDSSGRETFEKMHTQYPQVPIVILTATKDRSLALDLVKAGAADYITKDYTNDEVLFERIVLAATKAKTSMRVSEGAADSARALEKAKATLGTAKRSGEHPAIQAANLEVNTTVVDMLQKVFGQVQQISITQARDSVQLEQVVETTKMLDREVLRGFSDRPSLRSQIEQNSFSLQEMAKRLVVLEDSEKDRSDAELEAAKTTIEAVRADASQKIKALSDAEVTRQAQLSQVEISVRQDHTKLVLGVLGLLGVLVPALITYLVSK